MKTFCTLLCWLALAVSLHARASSQVDINSADARMLAESLDGIGLVKAEAIVAYRATHGPFRTIEDLAKVKGIGPRILEDNRHAIVFGAPKPSDSGPSAGRPFASWQ